MKYVWLVGERGPESNRISSIHETEQGAVKAFHKLRNMLLENAKTFKTEDPDKRVAVERMYQQMIDNLSEEDYKKIDNFPWDTPYIEKRALVK